MDERKIIGIFDLDGTIGWKTPSYPDITLENGGFLRKFVQIPMAEAIVATGRAMPQVETGLKRGGISPDEIGRIFAGLVLEDGLYVKKKDEVLYNALDKASEQYAMLRNSFYGEEAKEFFFEKGFYLASEFMVRKVQRKNGVDYLVLGFDGTFDGKILDGINEAGIEEVLYLQPNNVRATIKACLGYMDDDLARQRPLFERIEPMAYEFMLRYYENPEEHCHLVRWDDSVEIYPILGGNVFRKGEGVDLILERIDHDRNALLVFCCDGENDVSMVEHLGRNYADRHLVLMPSNANPALKRRVEEHNMQYGQKGFVLEEDCTRFGEGAMRLLRDRGHI